MAVPSIEQVTQIINNQGVQCCHITCPQISTFRLSDVLDVTGSGVFTWQMIAKTDTARTITIDIGGSVATFRLDISFAKYVQVYQGVNTSVSKDVNMVLPAGQYWFYHAQLEHGNQATDWHVSPDDTLDQIEKLYTESIQQSTDMVKDSQKILLQAMQEYVRTSDFDSFAQTVSTQFAVSAESVDINFYRMQQAINDLSDETSTEFQEWKKYIRFVDGSIILGEENNPLVLSLQNDRISFTSAGNEVAYFSNNKLYVSDIEVTQTMVITDLVFSKNQDGHILINVRG